MKTLRAFLCLPLWLVLMSGKALAIDLQPGDIIAPPPDLNLIQFSYLSSKYGDRYAQGQKTALNSNIHTSQFLVRMGRTFEVSDYAALFYVQTPIGYIHPDMTLPACHGRCEGDSGVGDSTMLFAFWPYANHETKTYFALGAYLTVPSGSYADDRLFNLSGNRYQSALQAGYQTPLLDNLAWSTAFDVTWSGDNNHYLSTFKREQEALYTGQTALQYFITPTYSVGTTLFYTAGGETSLNGSKQHDVMDLQRYQLTLVGWYAFGRITIQYGRDFKTDNGFIEDGRLILRYSKLF
jgi:hypothetical protein